MWEVKRNNVFGATAFSSYGGFWLSIGLLIILDYAGILTESAGALRYYLVLWSILTWILWLQTLAMNLALAALFFALAVLFILVAIAEGMDEANAFRKVRAF